MKKDLYPGWQMTIGQHAHYFTLWNAACRAQGWDRLPARERDGKRHQAHAAAFGVACSAKDINARKMFDQIKAEFQRLAGDIHHNDDKARKRLIHVAIERLDRLAEITAGNYVSTLLKERFKVIPGIRRVEDLSNKQLTDLISTCNARIRLLKQSPPVEVFAESSNIPF